MRNQKGRVNPNSREAREERRKNRENAEEKAWEKWTPKTKLGKMVISNEINSLEELFEKGQVPKESQIINFLIKDLEEKVIDFKKTSKMRRAGRIFSFRASAIVGDKDSWIGCGTAKDKEKMSAISKATQRAKLSVIKIKKGCGSWECNCHNPHSVPFLVEGKSASVRVKLIPAPKGTGLVIGDTAKEVLRLVGIKDVWSETKGATDTKLNFVLATINALSKTTKFKE